MRAATMIMILVLRSVLLIAQETETFFLKFAASKDDTIVYKRIIEFDKMNYLFHVRDYYENGQIQMDARYSSFDKEIKEDYQCNYHSNTKTGSYKEWYKNGRLKYAGNFDHGLRNGLSTSWYDTGQKEAEENWTKGQLHGKTRYWSADGKLQYDLLFEHGLNRNPKQAVYRFLTYKPKGYGSDTTKMWPLIIYLHGGSDRGNDLKKLYSQGIPDQIYRGREFPFLVISPQCPDFIRWSTEDWFEKFFSEIKAKYRIDTNRVYLTGMSLGGSGVGSPFLVHFKSR